MTTWCTELYVTMWLYEIVRNYIWLYGIVRNNNIGCMKSSNWLYGIVRNNICLYGIVRCDLVVRIPFFFIRSPLTHSLAIPSPLTHSLTHSLTRHSLTRHTLAIRSPLALPNLSLGTRSLFSDWVELLFACSLVWLVYLVPL